MSPSWSTFAGPRCPCPKARLPRLGWHRSAKGARVGRTAVGKWCWGPCLVTVGCAGAGFLPPATKSAQSFTAWLSLLYCTPWCSHDHLGVGCSPGTMWSWDPSQHGMTDLGINPWTTRFSGGTTSPGNSQDPQRASAPGEALEKHLSMVGTPLTSHVFAGCLHAHTSPGSPRGCPHPALPSPHLRPDPAVPACRRSPRSLLFQRGIKTNTSAGKCIAVVLEINN